MKKIILAYRQLNILSLDVTAGAMICALFFAKIFQITILPYGLVSLGLTVWIIYTADHLLDAKKIQQPASTERHRFHQRNFYVLFTILLLTILIDAVQLIFIRKIVFIEGLGLAFFIVIYFLLHRYLKLFKEVIGAVLYSGGVLLIPWSVNTSAITQAHSILIGQFAMTALINLFLFSWYDRQQDVKDKHASFATVMGDSAAKYSLKILFLVQAAFFLVQLVVGGMTTLFPNIILTMMNGILFLIFSERKYFERDDRYRLLGDAVFLLPLIYVLS